MTVALFRADDGAEILLSRVPKEFYIPDVLTLADANRSVEFRYVGDGKCAEKIAHGPGHQSSSTCEAIGTHETHHVANLGWAGEYVEWTDDDIAEGVAFHD